MVATKHYGDAGSRTSCGYVSELHTLAGVQNSSLSVSCPLVEASPHGSAGGGSGGDSPAGMDHPGSDRTDLTPEKRIVRIFRHPVPLFISLSKHHTLIYQTVFPVFLQSLFPTLSFIPSACAPSSFQTKVICFSLKELLIQWPCLTN